MPSPRAVLADILELKLDPTVAHTTVKSSGRLSGRPVEDAPVVEEVKQNEEKLEPKVEAKEKPAKAPKPPKKETQKVEDEKEKKEEIAKVEDVESVTSDQQL